MPDLVWPLPEFRSAFNAIPAADFASLFSSRLPTAQTGSSSDTSTNEAVSGISPTVRPEDKGAKGRVVKVTWWRPHGQTAIAPGLKRTTLRVRLDDSQIPGRAQPGVSFGVTAELIGADGVPDQTIMRHLLDLFMVHFGCQFPFVERAKVERDIERQTGSVFLHNSMAAVAARFSSHPSIALPNLRPHEYGNVFAGRAKALLGSMLAVPSRESVLAFLLLALTAAGNDSEFEVWMMTGLAVRMGLDLGLHLSPQPNSPISVEDHRLNRLLWWSVLILDLALSFGEGRQTTTPIEEVTQLIPTEQDFCLQPSGSTLPEMESPSIRSPFPYAAKQMFLFGPLINMLNVDSYRFTSELDRRLQVALAEAIRHYSELPPDMRWNVRNLQDQCGAQHGPIYLFLHLWMHTILASEDRILSKLGNAVSAVQTSVLDSARTIGDILVLSDIINPNAYLAIPFVNQSFYVAGCAYINEVEPHCFTANRVDTAPRDRQGEASTSGRTDISRSLLASVANESLITFQQGLSKQTKYWSCVARTTQSLEQHRQGIHDIDLVDITEKLETVVPLPDSGYAARHEDGGGGSHQAPQTSSSLLELERYLASSSADLPLAARPCLAGDSLGGLLSTRGIQDVVEDSVQFSDLDWLLGET